MSSSLATRTATASSTTDKTEGLSSTYTLASLKRRIIPQQTGDLKVFWARITLVAIVVTTAVCLAFEIWVVVSQRDLRDTLIPDADTQEELFDIWYNFKVELVYESVFLASIVFWLFVTWDAIIHLNSMELYAINFYNIGLFIYSITQIVQIKKDQELLVQNVPEVENADTGAFLAAQIMLPCVIGTFIPVFAFLTRKLVKDFGWRQYRITGGSIKLQKVFFAYDILLLLIKFSIFFLTGFTVIDLVLTEVTSQGKLLIPIIGSVAAFGVALSGFYGVRYEIKWLTVIYQVGTLAAVAYVGNRLYEAYNRGSEDISNISRIEVPFIMYSCASFLLLFGSFAYGIVCMMNFGTGLKEVLDQEKKKKLGEFQPPEIDLDA